MKYILDFYKIDYELTKKKKVIDYAIELQNQGFCLPFEGYKSIIEFGKKSLKVGELDYKKATKDQKKAISISGYAVCKFNKGDFSIKERNLYMANQLEEEGVNINLISEYFTTKEFPSSVGWYGNNKTNANDYSFK